MIPGDDVAIALVLFAGAVVIGVALSYVVQALRRRAPWWHAALAVLLALACAALAWSTREAW